ncbi:hypothetical protein M877_02190 [Streptomyces niveus NCIMB 11891]|nr:hypothetical protein M877_02190 [Streptomyces niveus NCIMB 11891]
MGLAVVLAEAWGASTPSDTGRTTAAQAATAARRARERRGPRALRGLREMFMGGLLLR